MAIFQNTEIYSTEKSCFLPSPLLSQETVLIDQIFQVEFELSPLIKVENKLESDLSSSPIQSSLFLHINLATF